MASVTKRSTSATRVADNPRSDLRGSACEDNVSLLRTGPIDIGLRGLVLATVVGVLMLLVPMATTGIWDPVELRVADAASRVAAALMHAKLPVAPEGVPVVLPTLGEIGRGELPYTSIALGFRVFGLHDWAGRLPLALWVIVALVATVAWVHRYVNTRAAVWAALIFPTIPIIFFQARFMLGDATTIGTLTASFACLCFGCIDPPRAGIMAVRARVSWILLGAVMSAAGVLSRGLLIAVAVPFLAVGATVVVAMPRRIPKQGSATAATIVTWVVLAVGIVASGVGVWITSRIAPQRGASLILQGTSLQRGFHPHAFDSIVSQIGHGLFPWSGALVFAIAALLRQLLRGMATDAHQRATSGLLMLMFLAAAAQTWLGSFGATFPFAASAAVAAISGIWLDGISQRGLGLRIVSIGVIALLVVLVADYENIPDKILAATASADAHLPASFKKESTQWAQGCCGVIFVSWLAFGFGFGDGTRRFWCKEERRSLIARGRKLWRGQLGFYVLLIETALVTGAILLLATRLGLPLRRLRDVGSPSRELLFWSWLAIPGLVVLLWLASPCLPLSIWFLPVDLGYRKSPSPKAYWDDSRRDAWHGIRFSDGLSSSAALFARSGF